MSPTKESPPALIAARASGASDDVLAAAEEEAVWMKETYPIPVTSYWPLT